MRQPSSRHSFKLNWCPRRLKGFSPVKGRWSRVRLRLEGIVERFRIATLLVRGRYRGARGFGLPNSRVWKITSAATAPTSLERNTLTSGTPGSIAGDLVVRSGQIRWGHCSPTKR